MAEYVCPWCSYPLLCHVRFGKPYWFCMHCNQEIPYGFSQTIANHNHFAEILKRYKLVSEHTRDIILFIRLDGRITEANKAALQAYGYEREELLNLTIHNLRLPGTCNDFVEEGGQGRNQGIVYETLHQRKDGSSFPVEVSYQEMGLGDEPVVLGIIRDISQQKQIEQLVDRQSKREQLMVSIQEQVCHSFSLPETLSGIVAGVRDFLQADRVIIHRFMPNWNGTAIAEAIDKDWPSMLGYLIHYPIILEKKYIQQYQKGEITSISDIQHAGLDRRLLQLLIFFKVKARLVIPILLQNPRICEVTPWQPDENTAETSSLSPQSCLWGLLIVHQCSNTRLWQQSEMDLLKGVAMQIAIAVQKSELSEQLQEAQHQLEQIASLDSLTLTANRQSFEEYLTLQWERMAETQKPLSLILGNIDCFQKYNDIYGQQAGNHSLKQIASVLRSVVTRTEALIARYSGGEFAIILPDTEVETATHIIEEVRFRIKALNIIHTQSTVSKYLTLSYGITCIIPSSQSSPIRFIKDAEKSLEQAKKVRRAYENKGGKDSPILSLPVPFQTQPQNLFVVNPDSNELNTNRDLLMSYVAFYVSRGKATISPLNGPIPFHGLVYEYWGYHKDFQHFWKQLQQRRDFSELYLEGDTDCFGYFLGGRCTVGQCARCNLPIPMPEGTAYTIPNCTLCNNSLSSGEKEVEAEWYQSDRKEAKTCLVALGTLPSDARALKKLFAINGFEVIFFENPEAIDDQFLPTIVDMVLIYADVSESQGKAWAQDLRRYLPLQSVPIIGLTPEAKFSLPWVEGSLGMEDYILTPLGGDRLAKHLRQVSQLQLASPSTEVYWFPR